MARFILSTALMAALASAQASFATPPFEYVGCVEADLTAFGLNIDFIKAFTPQECQAACAGKATYAALGGGCKCDVPSEGEPEVSFKIIDEAACTTPCVPDQPEQGFCGGPIGEGATRTFNLYKRAASTEEDHENMDDEDCEEAKAKVLAAAALVSPISEGAVVTQTVYQCPDDVDDCPYRAAASAAAAKLLLGPQVEPQATPVPLPSPQPEATPVPLPSPQPEATPGPLIVPLLVEGTPAILPATFPAGTPVPLPSPQPEPTPVPLPSPEPEATFGIQLAVGSDAAAVVPSIVFPPAPDTPVGTPVGTPVPLPTPVIQPNFVVPAADVAATPNARIAICPGPDCVVPPPADTLVVAPTFVTKLSVASPVASPVSTPDIVIVGGGSSDDNGSSTISGSSGSSSSSSGGADIGANEEPPVVSSGQKDDVAKVGMVSMVLAVIALVVL